MFSQDQDAITTIENHIKNIIGDHKILDGNYAPTNKHNYEFFMDWMSYQVQHPGKLLHFAPFIYSVSGCGKGFFFHLLKIILSDKEVQLLSHKEIKSRLNSYTLDRQVNVINDFNIYEKKDNFVLEHIKDYITNDNLIINTRRRINPTYNRSNHTNYLLITNNVKYLPLEDPKDRYWFIFSPITVDDITYHYTVAYFKTVFQALEHKDALKDYFRNRKISQEFLNYQGTPKTHTKNSFKGFIRVNTYGYQEAIDLLSNEHKYYNKKIIISNEFFLALEKKGIHIRNKNIKRWFLESLNYVRFGKALLSYETYSASRVFIKDILYHDNLTKPDIKEIYKHALDQESE